MFYACFQMALCKVTVSEGSRTLDGLIPAKICADSEEKCLRLLLTKIPKTMRFKKESIRYVPKELNRAMTRFEFHGINVQDG